MSIEAKRREWERAQARIVHPVDDDIARLADEIYEDMKATLVARVRGERQKGALVGLGFKAWMGPWGGWTEPDTQFAVNRILGSLVDKPYYARLAKIGIVGHPQRRVDLRAEWLKPYCRIDSGTGTIRWGLEETRERDEVFKATYDYVYLKVIDNGEIVAKAESATFDNGNTFIELGLNDDDYRFEVGYAAHDWSRGGKWFDFAIVEGEWTQLLPQGRDWDGEYGDSGITHAGTERIAEPSAEERAQAYFAKRRIERENKAYGHLADRYDAATVEQYLSNAIDNHDRRAADLWAIVKRIRDDRGAPAAAQDVTVDQALVAKVRGYAAETHEGPMHVERWMRVLAAFGEDNGHAPMAAAEAQTYADRGWKRWEPVVAALREIEGG